MVKTPDIQPGSPLMRTLYNPYRISFEGVSTMAHGRFQDSGVASGAPMTGIL